MKLPLLAAVVPLSLAACATPLPPDVLPAFGIADPASQTRQTHYHPVIVGYTHREPVEPEDWRRLNERLSPAERGNGS